MLLLLILACGNLFAPAPTPPVPPETAAAARLRAELIQVAAVAVAWIEKIDRQAKAR